MPRRRPNTTDPDPQLVADFASCLRDSPHVRTLVGLMFARGIEIVPVRGATDHGVDWAAIVVQGRDDAESLMRIAAVMRAALDAERLRLRLIAERG